MMGVAAIFAALLSPQAGLAETVAGTLAKCSQCHQMSGPAKKSLSARQQRKGPPLFYAGDKFRKGWLESWLQNPTRIRPAGDYPPPVSEPGTKSDVVNPEKLSPHPRLDAATARAVTAHLMSLRPKKALLAKEDYKPGRISERMGAMNFVKFQGCAACHKDTPKYGGISGPELYTAWTRLQPAFIASYIRNPTAWEPRSLMPNKHLNSVPVKKLADYLRTIGMKKRTGK